MVRILDLYYCCYYYHYYNNHYFNPHPRVYLVILERGKGREGLWGRGRRDIDVRKKQINCLSFVPHEEIKLTTFWYMGQHPNQLNHLTRARILDLDDRNR